MGSPARDGCDLVHEHAIGIIKQLAGFQGNASPAFIGGMGSNGLSFVWSLGSRRIPVVAMDTWRSPATFSRYGMPLVIPDPSAEEASLLALLQEIGEGLQTRGVMIPATDPFVLFMSKNSRSLSKHYDFNVADYETVLSLTNKRRQYESACRLGIPTPLTMYPSEVSIEVVAREMSYPCILKPYFSHLWKRYLDARRETRWGKVGIARSASELVETYGEMKKSGLDFLVQRVVPGNDDLLYDMLTYLTSSSEPLAVFTKHKIRTWPLDFGVSSIAVGSWEPEVASLGLRLVQGIKYRGVVSPEFKRDPVDGQLKLMEVNPRSILTTGLAVASGMDIPYIAYRDSKGDPVEEVKSFRPGVKWISFDRDLKAFLAYWRTGRLDLAGWLASWRGKRRFAFYRADDPLPACIGLWQFATSEFSASIRHKGAEGRSS